MNSDTYSDLENDNPSTFRGVKFTEDSVHKENEDTEEATKSQMSMSSAVRLLSKNHPFLESLYGAIYAMTKENHLYSLAAMITLVVDVVQMLAYLYWPEFHWDVTGLQDTLFYSHLTGDSPTLFWFWAGLALALFLLLSVVAIQFKLKNSAQSTNLVRVLRLTAGTTTTVLCIPLITALVKPFECMIRGSDASWFSDSCYSGEHMASFVVSIIFLIPLVPLILIIAVTYYDPSPTLNLNSFTKSSSRHDALFVLVKMGLVASFTLLVDWPVLPVLILGGTSLGLGVLYHRFPPFHLALLNWAHTGFFLALAAASLIQLCVVISGSNGVIYFAVSIVVLLLAFGAGVWSARRKTLPLHNDGITIDARKWHHPWDVETSASFLMPYLYRRVDEEEGDDDSEEQRFVFDEECAERIKAIYSRGIRRYPRSTFLRVRLAMFLTSVMGTPDSIHAARGHVFRAMKMHHYLDLQFTIYYLRKMWENEHEVSGMGESKMDIISSIEMQRNFKVASQSHHRAKHYIGTFWQLLLNGNTDPDVLASVIENIEKHEVNAQRAYAKLISRFPNSVRVLREYATFCSEVKNDQEAAQRVYALADQLEEEQSKVRGSRARRRSSSRSDAEDDRQSACSTDLGGSCTDLSEGGSSNHLGRSFIYRSRIQKPPQIRMLNVKLWIVLTMILGVLITMVMLSYTNVGLYKATTDHMVEVLGGQTSAQRATLYLAITRAHAIPLPPFGSYEEQPTATRLSEFKESMHSAYPRRFSHYGFNGLKEFWASDDLCTQIYAGNGQYVEECMNYWGAVTRFLTYASSVLDAAPTSLLTAEAWANYAPFRWIIDNTNTVMQSHGVKLADVIIDEEEWVHSVHLTTMLCFTIGSCAVTILAMGFFIRPAVISIREGRNSMLSLFHGIPRDIIRQRRDFYNKNPEEQNENWALQTSEDCEKKWNSLYIALLATGVICALIVISGVVTITLMDGLSARSIRCMAERQLVFSQTVVGSMEVLYDDGIRATTLQDVIKNFERLVNASSYAAHTLEFGCPKHKSPQPTLDDRIAEMVYEKVSDEYPMPMNHYVRVFIDASREMLREVKAAYPTQLAFTESTGFLSLLDVVSAVVEGLGILTEQVMSSSKDANHVASTTIMIVMILSLVLIAAIYYVVLIQYLVRRLYYESRRTMRMFLLIPEEAITKSDDLRQFLESNGTDSRSKKSNTSTSKTDETASLLQEGVLTVDSSSGSIVAANKGACALFGYSEEHGGGWPGLSALMPEVDLSGPDVDALRTKILVSGSEDAVRVVYDLHHWGAVAVVKVRRLRALEEGKVAPSTIRCELLRLSEKPLMLLDDDGFVQAAQDALLTLVGYPCVEDLPHVHSLLPHLDENDENNENGIVTEVVCKNGDRKPVRMEYRRGGIVTLVQTTPRDEAGANTPLLLHGEFDTASAV